MSLLKAVLSVWSFLQVRDGCKCISICTPIRYSRVSSCKAKTGG